MKIVVSRSLNSNVIVREKIVGQIDKGLVLLVGFTYDDKVEDIDYMIKKIINLRIFDDENGIMNKSLLDVRGKILSVSQFTLYADTKKGNRPSYQKALSFDKAKELYDIFNEKIRNENIIVETGIFGEDMNLNISNDGPVTIILESSDRNVKK